MPSSSLYRTPGIASALSPFLQSHCSQISICTTPCLLVKALISQSEWTFHLNIIPWPSVWTLVFTTLSYNYKICLSSSLVWVSQRKGPYLIHPMSLPLRVHHSVFLRLRTLPALFIVSSVPSSVPGSSEMLNKHFLNWNDFFFFFWNSHSQLRQNQNWSADLFAL